MSEGMSLRENIAELYSSFSCINCTLVKEDCKYESEYLCFADQVLRLVVDAVEGMPLIDTKLIKVREEFLLNIAAEAQRDAIVQRLKEGMDDTS